jgi:hypothetical protein
MTRINFDCHVKVDGSVITAKDFLATPICIKCYLTLLTVALKDNAIRKTGTLIIFVNKRTVDLKISLVSWLKVDRLFVIHRVAVLLEALFMHFIQLCHSQTGCFNLINLLQISAFESHVQITQNVIEMSRSIWLQPFFFRSR